MANKENIKKMGQVKKNETLADFEVLELAAHMCNTDPDGDENEIEQAFYNKFDCDINQFKAILEELWPKLGFGVSPLTQTALVGFLNEKRDMWIAKKEVPDYINSILVWMSADELTENKKAKGFERVITDGDQKPLYTLTLKKIKK